MVLRDFDHLPDPSSTLILMPDEPIMSVHRYRVERRRPAPTVWIATQTSIVYLFGTPEWTKKRVGPWLNLNPCSAAP
jgi:hypothetical protein